MANQNIINSLGLDVNGVKYNYKTNTLMYSPGNPETKVEGTSPSGIATSQDLNTYFGVVKFTLFPTKANIAAYKDWQAKGKAGNVVRIFGDDSFSLMNASLMNKIEIGIGSDGEIAIEFHGEAESN